MAGEAAAQWPGEEVLNGVDTVRLGEMVREVRADPGQGELQLRVANRWLEGGRNRTTITSYRRAGGEEQHLRPFTLEADEPPVLLGEDGAPGPTEYLLAALSACLTTSLAYHAAAHGVRLESVESSCEGDLDLRGFLDLDPKIRKGFREIRMRFRIRGDADEARLLGLMKRSPVFDTIVNPTPVKITIERL